MIINKVTTLFKKNLRKISFELVLVVSLFHFISSNLLFNLAGEQVITSGFVNYFYFWVVTASTVGFGDITPNSPIGKMIVALYFIPFSLVMFSLIIVKVGDSVTKKLRKYTMGSTDFSHLKNHIILINNNQTRIKNIVDLIFADKKRENKTLLIVTTDDIQHPYVDDDNIEFCKVTSYSDLSSLERIAISKASRVIIDGGSNDSNFSNAIHFKNKVNENCHISTYITDEDKASTLRDLNGNIEVTTPKIAEQLVRTMQDHGASMAVHQLLTSGYGQTIFVSKLHGNSDIIVKDLTDYINGQYKAKFLGFASKELGTDLIINPDDHIRLKVGSYIHYVNDSRISKLQLPLEAG